MWQRWIRESRTAAHSDVPKACKYGKSLNYNKRKKKHILIDIDWQKKKADQYTEYETIYWLTEKIDWSIHWKWKYDTDWKKKKVLMHTLNMKL